MKWPSDFDRSLQYRALWYWALDLGFDIVEESIPGFWDIIADLATGDAFEHRYTLTRAD